VSNRYSPSLTSLHEECSLKLILNQESWKLREWGRENYAMVAGLGFAKGSECLHRGWKLFGIKPVDEATIHHAVMAAQNIVTETVTYERSCGCIIAQEDIDRIVSELGRTVRRYAKESPLLQWKRITHVEHTYPNWGYSRIDVAGEDRFGIVSVADTKYKRNLDSDRIHWAAEEYRYDWQFLHNCRTFTEDMGLQGPARSYLILVVAMPVWHCIEVRFEYSPEMLALWEKSAERKWVDMTDLFEGRRTPTIATSHYTKYGRCPYYKACLEYHLDEGLMEIDYVKVPRRKE